MDDLRKDEIRRRLIDVMGKYNKAHLGYDLNNLSTRELLNVLEKLLVSMECSLWE